MACDGLNRLVCASGEWGVAQHLCGDGCSGGRGAWDRITDIPSTGRQALHSSYRLQPDRFITATHGGGTGRFQWTARDNQIAEQEAVEFERYGITQP
jgi:hypothetical protein